MPAALPIAIGGAGALSFLGARSQAGAAKDAAKIQAESAEKALALQREMWQQQQANQAPWVSAGQGAVSTLARLMGTPTPAVNVPRATPTAAPDQTRNNVLARLAGADRAFVSRLANSALTKGGLVALRAPDGTVQAVPQAQADHYMRLGAVQV